MKNLVTSTYTTSALPGDTSKLSADQHYPNHPEFFRLPGRGGDRFFGLSRSQYYEWERAGKLRMVRLRREGATRGIVLIPYSAVRAIVEAAATDVSR